MATNLKFKQETAQLSTVQFHMIKQKKKIYIPDTKNPMYHHHHLLPFHQTKKATP